MTVHNFVILAVTIIVIGASLHKDPIKQVRGMMWAVLLLLAYLMDNMQ
jgi:hypothetical protein